MHWHRNYRATSRTRSGDRGTVTWAKMIECRFARVPKYDASSASESRCFPSHKQERESDDRQVEHVYSMRLNAWKREAPVNPLLPYIRKHVREDLKERLRQR